METVAYVYKWIHLPTGKWYIGSRTRAGSHPEDGYYCSSKIVKPLILSNPNEWKREILATGTPADMYALETKLLQDSNAKHDSASYNQHNNDRSPIRTGIPHTPQSIDKMSGPRKPYGPQTPNHIEKRAVKKRGIGRPDLGLLNRSRVGINNSNFGKIQSDEWKLKNSIANSGKPKPQINCPHCGVTGGTGVMSRWHFNNCKQKKDQP